ncbi:MAG TPA: hypothetical protein VFX07_02360 [Candidatus Udaeobacter sp.]|nr:hypothetical protein [Candidatus Udaeobacter sp.]
MGKAVDSKESFKRDPQALRFSLAGIIEEHVQDFEDPSGFFRGPRQQSLPNPGSRLIFQTTGPAMSFIIRLLLAVISLTTILHGISQGAEPPRKKQAASANARGAENKPVHLVVRSQADIKQTFTYYPRPAIPDELQGYTGTQVGGTGTYRMVVDGQGAVTQVTILKGFTVTAVYDERMSDMKGNAVPELDKVMIQALQRWRAHSGPMRIVDIYWSFGPQPWVNYGKGNAPK